MFRNAPFLLGSEWQVDARNVDVFGGARDVSVYAMCARISPP